MKTEQAKAALTGMIDLAKSADNRGDVAQRQSWLRSIEDLPLPAVYVRAALAKHNLLATYKGP